MPAQIPSASTVRMVTVQGGTLFAIAAVYLGDALQWTRIAALNGLSDPWLDEQVRTLKIPPVEPSATSTGILGA